MEKNYFTYTKNRNGSNFIHNAPIKKWYVQLSVIHKRGSLELLEKFIEFSRSIKLIQIHETVLITGSITAELV